jgi:hypothetical protein
LITHSHLNETRQIHSELFELRSYADKRYFDDRSWGSSHSHDLEKLSRARGDQSAIAFAQGLGIDEIGANAKGHRTRLDKVGRRFQRNSTRGN